MKDDCAKKRRRSPRLGVPTAILRTSDEGVGGSWQDDDDEPRKDDACSQASSASLSKLLDDWVGHHDESFHLFSQEEAREIRRWLLQWYDVNRRKLPWRGDPPAYDGSTAGTATKARIPASAASSSHKQTKIAQFFRPGHAQPKDNQTTDVIPISGYSVWVSEIMLQQTRVDAVIPYYLKWMKRFPTVEALAAASEDDVNAHWAGLGFYRRARLLHQGAKMVAAHPYNGDVPSTSAELLKISGIGPYTAAAIASQAFGECVPVVDGNVCRVLCRLCGIANHIKAPVLKDDFGWVLAKQIVEAFDDTEQLSKSRAGDVNQALMELGATYCAPSGSGIDPRDPLRNFYLSTKLGRAIHSHHSLCKNEDFVAAPSSKRRRCRVCDANGIAAVVSQVTDGLEEYKDCRDPESMLQRAAVAGHAAFPLAPPKPSKREEVLAVAAISLLPENNANGEERWLMVRRPPNGLLAGQWEFPNVCVWSSADDTAAKGSKKKNAKKRKSDEGDKGASSVPVKVQVVDVKVRKEALDEFLGSIKVNLTPSNDVDEKDARRSDLDTVGQSLAAYRRLVCSADEPLVHVFSHVRHSMWVEWAQIASLSDVAPGSDAESAVWFTCGTNSCEDGTRDVRWMSPADMKEVGVTSGVKKVLSLVTSVRGKDRKQQQKNKR